MNSLDFSINNEFASLRVLVLVRFQPRVPLITVNRIFRYTHLYGLYAIPVFFLLPSFLNSRKL